MPLPARERAHPAGLAPPWGLGRGERENTLSCPGKAAPAACVAPGQRRQELPPRQSRPAPHREPAGRDALRGAGDAQAPHGPHPTEKVFMGSFAKKEDEPRAKLKITSRVIRRESQGLLALQRLFVALGPEAAGAAVGHGPRHRGEPGLCWFLGLTGSPMYVPESNSDRNFV